MIKVNFCFFAMCLLRINLPNLCPNMIHVDALDFSGWHSKEVMFLLTLSVHVHTFFENNYLTDYHQMPFACSVILKCMSYLSLCALCEVVYNKIPPNRLKIKELPLRYKVAINILVYQSLMIAYEVWLLIRSIFSYLYHTFVNFVCLCEYIYLSKYWLCVKR